MSRVLDAAVRNRQRIERAVCSALIKAGLHAGYKITVDNGEEEVLKESTNKSEILKEMFSVDEERLWFHKDGKKLGVFLVYGNYGWDVIADYHVPLEHLMDEPNKVADSYVNA
jgi:hypothetical protein